MAKLILVTGGAGFVGSHLCERLVKEGHQVISLDNYFTGSRDNHIDGVEYREGHTKNIGSLVPETPDLIYHLGEYSRVKIAIDEPEVVWDLNIAGTFAVVEYARKKNIRLVYAGSSTKELAPRADGTPGRNLSPYTWSKAANSDLVGNYRQWYGLPFSVAYFYNVYGPRERGGVENYGTVVETFRQNVLAGKPHTVSAPGTQTRAFTHVLDTVSALMLIGEKGEPGEYPISAKETLSLLDVANLFGGEVELGPVTQTTHTSTAEDTSAIEALGWKQEHTLAQYIEESKAA